jgi:hypothetical protein
MSKTTLHLLGDCGDAKKLAKLYENITGKRPSPVEIKAMQAKIDAAKAKRGLQASK